MIRIVSRFARSQSVWCLRVIVIAAAFDLSGTWALNLIDRDGTHRQGYCTFKQDGSRLSGTCGEQVKDGRAASGGIDDKDVTWTVDGGAAYTATLDQSGTFMRGRYTQNGGGVFTAMKTK
jgi:hypothetical protein